MSPVPTFDDRIRGADDASKLTVENAFDLRARSDVMPTSVAPACSSDMFKSPNCYHKPRAKCFNHRLSTEAKRRQPSTLKAAAMFLKDPDLISLCGGLPSPEYFPFENLQLQVPSREALSKRRVNMGKSMENMDSVLRAGKSDIREGKSVYDLEIALNYGQATGSAQLMRFVTEHTEIIHDPPYSDWQCCLTAGSTYAWDTTLRILCEKGDFIITEEYTFASAIETATPLGLRVLGVEMDDYGLVPEALDDSLNNWNYQTRGARKPFLLYLIPTGQNPTGATMPLARREAIYKVAQKHDLFIVEDEPYYFLQMQAYSSRGTELASEVSRGEFLASLVPSFLSLDSDGRVLRMESFSKVISPGARTGWIVAPQQLVDRFARNFEVSSQHPSGISQLALFKLLDEYWGHAGYIDWLINLRIEYSRRRDVMIHAFEKFLPKEVARWKVPAAGMFCWIEIEWRKHPGMALKGDHDSIEEEIFLSAVQNQVLLSRGSWFKANSAQQENRMFFRATFAAASPEKMVEAIRRFSDVLRVQFHISL